MPCGRRLLLGPGVENRGRLILLRSEALSLRAELQRGEARLDWRLRRNRLIQERDAYEAEASQAGQTIERDREALTAVSTRRNTAIDAISEAAAAHADLEGEAKSLARQSELLQAGLSRTEGRLKEREVSLRAIDAEAASINERTAAATVELAALRDELATLTGEMAPAEEEFSHLGNRERTLREQATTARAGALAAERADLESDAVVKLRA